ncbi:LCP family protein [Lottiidibacillus patelloidae]|uniref:LCP family protein n=1 Tax=Lottiidibacillus patelloidae TaxID=2670334 RepID=UPI001E468F14|nr:LCP family protein [Lottiidibacillus patelloidae]
MINKIILKKILLWTLIPLAVVVISASSYALYLTQKVADVLDEGSDSRVELNRGETSSKRKPNSVVDPTKDNISILFLGIDTSNAKGRGGKARTDAMLLATFNEKDKSIQMLSIPRDTYVYLPTMGYSDRISHAHAYDGVDGAVAAVEEMLNVPVDYFVRLNFYGFIEIVDALGGVEVYVPFTFREQDSNDNKGAILLEKGNQLLDGEHALAFARMRKYDNDFKRGDRQQEVLKAIINKTVSLKSITKYSTIIDAVGKNMVTNLSFKDVVSLHDYFTKGSKLSMNSIKLTGTDWYNTAESGKYYFQVNDSSLEEASKALRLHLELDEEETSSVADNN